MNSGAALVVVTFDSRFRGGGKNVLATMGTITRYILDPGLKYFFETNFVWCKIKIIRRRINIKT